MINSSLVSIIIPTYNRASLIGETLDSVLAQTYTNWECIVVDDGSSDNTDEVVGEYVARDNRFQYHKRPDTHKPGGNGARNYGFELSKGEYINWFDSDDLMSNNKIDEQIKSVVYQADGVISICKWKKFRNNIHEENENRNYTFFKNYLMPKEIFEDFGNSKSFIPSHGYLISRDIISKSGLWNENLKINQDGEFFTRVILNASKIYYASQAEVYYRIQPLISTSSLNSIEKAKSSILSWQNIENELLLNGITNSSYVENAKIFLYKKLVKEYKSVIRSNKEFFKTQIKENSFFNRLKRKIF